MPMGWVAAATAVAGALSANASQQAAGQQAGAAKNATQTQLQMFNTQNQQQAPYRQIGQSSLATLGNFAGLPGYAPQTTPSFIWQGQDFGTEAQFRQAQIENWQRIYGPNGLPPNMALIDDLVQQARAQNPGAMLPASAAANTGAFTHQFTNADLQTQLAPNYQFMLQQGLGALGNMTNAAGGGFSNAGAPGGNLTQGAIKYAEDYAGNAYQNAFTNYQSQQSNIFNRLAAIAGIGQQSNAVTAGLSGSLAPSISNTMMNAGAAQAGGTIGSANAISGSLNNALGYYTLNNIMNSGTISNPNYAAG